MSDEPTRDSDADAIEREPSEQEALEAAALAEALAGGRGQDEPPVDALETAALLRFSGREGELDPERAQALLSELTPRLAARPRRPRRRGGLVSWVLGMAAAAACAALWISVAPRHEAPATTPGEPAAEGSVAGLPPPPPKLLAAQAELAAGAAAGEPAFESAMRGYRDEVLRAIERAYPAPVGCLEPDARSADPDVEKRRRR